MDSAIFRAVLLLALLALPGCSPQEPPSWPLGGAPLALTPARWDGGEEPVEIHADGKVLEGGDLVFVIDRVGRVVDADYDPVAILSPEGRVTGTDNQEMGQVGVTNAAPPWSPRAWLAVSPDGNVTYFNPDGERAALGRWQGCNGPALRTCTLITHLITLRHVHAAQNGPSVGVGIGVGVGF